MAFAGSNTDVKPNDRLPILEVTHEPVRRKKYLRTKKHILKRMTRLAQRTQSVTNRYFGGYVGKRQPAGALETKRCIDKLYTLRAKIAGRGQAAQLRAASGRLITETEMNSTYRGAVEVVDLERRLHPSDVLFAECIRSFNSHDIDGRSWMYRLEASLLGRAMQDNEIDDYVPPTKRPNIRTDRAKANEIDVYGYRPLQHPWRLLSPYEFLQNWRAEPLLPPSEYAKRGIAPRTRWTAAGLEFIQRKEYTEERIAAKAGTHFVVLPPQAHEYFVFPTEPDDFFKDFRNAWVLVEKRRPDVIVIEGLRMPSASRTNTENAKYCSLFFRPWTLLHGDARVPHLSLLGCSREIVCKVYERNRPRTAGPAKRVRATRKQAEKCREPMLQHVQWHRTWEEYVRGHVVSHTAARPD